MEDVQATRTEYLRIKNQISLGEQGLDLLKKKRDALLMELMKIMETVLGVTNELEELAVKAGHSLAIAKAVDGFVTLKSAGLATKGDLKIEITGSHVMGVPVPEIHSGPVVRSTFDRGYGLIGISSRIEETAEKFEKFVQLIITLAAVETKLKRMAVEISATKRRVNALEQVVIPDLKQKLKVIEAALEERSREDMFRLKKVKRALEAKKAAQVEAYG